MYYKLGLIKMTSVFLRMGLYASWLSCKLGKPLIGKDRVVNEGERSYRRYH